MKRAHAVLFSLVRFCALALALPVAVVPAAPAAFAAEPTVILLSWDGVRWDYPDMRPFPGLGRIEREGLRAEKLIAGWPSITFPGHVTMATGTWADVHGIVDNKFVDRKRGLYDYSKDADWIDAEPLWIAAERQGVKAATYFWVGSETDWHGRGASYRVTPFDGAVFEDVKVDKILSWLDLPEADRPHLVMSYWHGTDHVAHDNGPDGPVVLDALAGQDVQLVRLLDGIDARGLWPTTTLLLVSDHGMTEVSDFFDLADFMAAHGIKGKFASSGPLVQVFLDDPSQAPALVEALKSQSGLHAYRGDDLPATMHLHHPTRTGDVVVYADPPKAISRVPWYQQIVFEIGHACCGVRRGTHGYDPNLPDMGGILMALGRGVPKGMRAPAASQIDIAPTVAKLLGIAPPLNAIGQPVPAIEAP